MGPSKAREAQILGFTDKALDTTWLAAREELAFIEKERERRSIEKLAKDLGCSIEKAGYLSRKLRGETVRTVAGCVTVTELDPDTLQATDHTVRHSFADVSGQHDPEEFADHLREMGAPIPEGSVAWCTKHSIQHGDTKEKQRLAHAIRHTTQGNRPPTDDT